MPLFSPRATAARLSGQVHTAEAAESARDTAAAAATAAATAEAYAHVSHAELTDLRAVQRTFDGAYARTALAQLGYAVVILRLFSADFYYIGLAYTLLALLLLLASAYRHNLVVHFLPTPAPSPTTATPLLCAVAPASAAHDDAGLGVQLAPAAAGPASQAMSRAPSALSATSTTSTARTTAPRTRQRHMAMASHLFTAGDVVALLSAGMLLVQVALFVLVLRL